MQLVVVHVLLVSLRGGARYALGQDCIGDRNGELRLDIELDSLDY